MRLLLEVAIYAVNICVQYVSYVIDSLAARYVYAIPLFIFSVAWIFYCIKKNRLKSLVVPFIVIEIVCAVIWGGFAVITHDESEHLHCAWMVSKGLLPYKDFWQHHSPMLWAILALFMKGLKATIWVFPMARLLCAALFAGIGAIGWMTAKKVWGERANLPFYLLLLLSGDFLSNFINLRPLCFMTAFLLLGIYFSFRISEYRNLPAFLAGALIAFGLSFDMREILFLALPVPFILLEDRKQAARRLLLFAAGIVVGSMPLLFYLVRHNILQDFMFWALLINYYKFKIGLGPLALIITAVAAAGWFLLMSAYQRYAGAKGPIILAVCMICSVVGLLALGVVPHYYLFFLFVLSVILLSRFSIEGMLRALKFGDLKRSIALGLVLTILVIPGFQIQRPPLLLKRMAAVSKIMKICENEPCSVLAPYHPVFAYDAIGLYSQWQFTFLATTREARGYVAGKGIADRIMAVRPAAISYYMLEENIFNKLLAMNLMSQAEFDELNAFLGAQYSVQDIEGIKFYIRNDKVEGRGI
jgi:hypothetical protein